MQECRMAMGLLAPVPIEVGEGKTKSCAQFSFAADSGQTTRSSGVGRTLSPWAKLHILAWQMRVWDASYPMVPFHIQKEI